MKKKLLLLLTTLFMTNAYSSDSLKKPSKRIERITMQAQDTLGIPKDEQAVVLPIDVLAEELEKLNLPKGLVPNGAATRWQGKRTIFVSENKLYPYGFEQFIALHEGTHVKHGDFEPSLLSTISTFLSLDSYLRGHRERRADTTAAKAIGCETCLSEVSLINQVGEILHPETAQKKQAMGYLSSQELQEINHQCHKGKRCEYHGSLAKKMFERNELAFQ